MKQTLRSPQGIAGLLLLMLGVALGLNYDPTMYQSKDPLAATTPQTYARIAYERAQKEQEREEELVFIWGTIGFGILALGSAWWQAKRKISGEPSDTENTRSSDPVT